jgi:hypothetical protein
MLSIDLEIRPIYHQKEHRIDAHIFVAFLAYCLQVTLKIRLMAYAPADTNSCSQETRNDPNDRCLYPTCDAPPLTHLETLSPKPSRLRRRHSMSQARY